MKHGILMVKLNETNTKSEINLNSCKTDLKMGKKIMISTICLGIIFLLTAIMLLGVGIGIGAVVMPIGFPLLILFGTCFLFSATVLLSLGLVMHSHIKTEMKHRAQMFDRTTPLVRSESVSRIFGEEQMLPSARRKSF